MSKLTDMTILLMAVFGALSFVSPLPVENAAEIFRLFSIMALGAVLLEYVPRILKRINDERISAIVGPVALLLAICVIIYGINPEAVNDPNLMVYMTAAVCAVMIGWRLLKLYLVRRWGQPVKDNDKNV